MCAVLDDPAGVEHVDAVDIADRAEPLREHDSGDAQQAERLLHQRLSAVVDLRWVTGSETDLFELDETAVDESAGDESAFAAGGVCRGPTQVMTPKRCRALGASASIFQILLPPSRRQPPTPYGGAQEEQAELRRGGHLGVGSLRVLLLQVARVVPQRLLEVTGTSCPSWMLHDTTPMLSCADLIRHRAAHALQHAVAQ